MINNYANILWVQIDRGTHLGRDSIMFFGVLFLMLFSSLNVVGQSTVTPSFQHIDAKDRGNASLGSEANITLAVDTDSQGNVYLLTFGNGVYKYNPVTGIFSKIITDVLGAAGNLNAPLDLAIDNNDIIHIADGDSKLIKKFSTSGLPLGDIGSGSGGNGKNEFWEPTGIEFDNDNNLFVVDAYRGDNAAVTQKYFLKIYYNDGRFKSFQGTSEHPINNPYRVAANDNYILISHSENNGEVLVFNKDLSFNKILTDIGSPGSLFIDEFDFIYAVDYAERLNFSQIFKLIKGTLPLFPEGLNLYNNIEEGINNSEFKIKIYDSNLKIVNSISEPKNPASGQDHLQLPIDLTLDKCSKLYLDDANIASFVTLNFDLEIYNRTPSFDTEKPVIVSCPGDQTESLTAGSFILPDYRSLANFSDNCDNDLTLVQSPAVGGIITKTTTITITAKDDAGNSSSCEFEVIIETSTDTEKPVITCPDPITQNVDPGKCGAIVIFADATATDNSGNVTVTLISNLPSGSEFPVGESTFTFEAKDIEGNTSECSFIITVEDNQNPTISCPNPISETVAFGESGRVITYAAPSSADNCSGSIITQTAGLASGSEFPLGKTTNTFVVTDASGNTATCSFDVTITENTDVEKPLITCPAPITQNVDSGKCGAVVTFANATATDNSGNVTVTLISNLPSGSEFPVGESTVTFEAKDTAGNTSECSFVITVEDNQNPTISCPNPISDTVAFGESGKVITYTAPIFEDNCSGSSINQTSGLASGSEFPLGTTTNTFVVTDASENTAECSFTITVTEDSDTEVPVINCPATITINVDPGSCGAIVNYATPTATDNSGSAVVSLKSGFASGSVFPVGITTVIYEAEDAAGNKAECSFNITVIDNEDPTNTCPSDKTENVAYGQSEKIVTYNLPVFNDNCPGSTIVQTTGLASGSNFPLGTTTNTFVVTDASGNTAECSFTITITEDSDTEVPVITCPAAITINVDSGTCGAVANYTTPTATDNSGTPTVRFKSGLASGSVFPVGITTVIYEAEDAAGNKAECSFNITVIDNEGPIITCPSDKTENYDPAIGFNLPDYSGLGITNDNCRFVNVTQFPAIGTLVTGNTQIILTATDAADNSSTCTFMVNLSENEVLEIDCPVDQIGQLNENCQFTIPDYRGLATVNFQNAIITQSPLAGTIVSTATIIKLTAALNGQTVDCSFQLILEDTIAPVAKCATGYDIWLNANGTASLNATEINKESSDNCGIVSMEIDKTTFTSADIGVIMVTLTVIDVSGNSDSCETLVTVRPYEGSGTNFSCLTEFVLQLDESGNAVLNAEDLYSGDAGDRIFTISKSAFDCSNMGANEVTLTYTGSDGSGTCGINVIVEDRISPEARARNINVTLDSFGIATITPEMIDNGSTDNCGTLSFSLDRISFSCIDLGENVITLTVKDAQGNIASRTAIVNISGNCVEEPEEPSVETFEYIFIYPNPTPGPFTFDTPSGWSIEKVDVYDTRGRYVLTETYSENQIEYSMNLSSLQQAVYILKLYTSRGIRIIRVIIY